MILPVGASSFKEAMIIGAESLAADWAAAVDVGSEKNHGSIRRIFF